MKKIFNKKTMFYLVVTTMFFGMVGCTKEKEIKVSEKVVEEVYEKDYYPITISNYNFKKEPINLVFKEEPKRVIAVYQNSIETLLALGLEDKIVLASGLDHDVKDDFTIPFESVKYSNTIPTKEEVLSLEPDFILSWYSLFEDKKLGDVDFWIDRNINTYMAQNSGVSKNDSLENEYQDILNIGRIFNVEDRALDIVDEMKNKISDTAKKVEGKEKIRSIILEVEKENTFRNYGEDSIGGNIATSVGADLVKKENGNFGAEDLIKFNPSVIFTVYYGDNIAKDEAISLIMDNKNLVNVEAVKQGRVYPIMLSEVYASGVRTHEGINSIINGLYPELD